MKKPTKRFGLAVAVLGLTAMASGQARAGMVYSNGPTDGHGTAYSISGPNGVSNSFTVSVDTILTNAIAGLWVVSGNTPGTLDWSIGSTEFGSDVASGTASLSNTLHNTALGGFFSVYESTFSLSGSLAAGNYWLTLGNALTTTSRTVDVFWDQNGGASSAMQSSGFSQHSLASSESFRLYGDPVVSPVPEPSTVALACSAVPVGLGLAWKRRRKQAFA